MSKDTSIPADPSACVPRIPPGRKVNPDCHPFAPLSPEEEFATNAAEQFTVRELVSSKTGVTLECV
jgi:hypothetical protein